MKKDNHTKNLEARAFAIDATLDEDLPTSRMVQESYLIGLLIHLGLDVLLYHILVEQYDGQPIEMLTDEQFTRLKSQVGDMVRILPDSGAGPQ